MAQEKYHDTYKQNINGGLKKIRIVTNRGIASQDIPSRDFYEVHAFYSTETVRIEEKLMLFPETIYQFYE